MSKIETTETTEETTRNEYEEVFITLNSFNSSRRSIPIDYDEVPIKGLVMKRREHSSELREAYTLAFRSMFEESNEGMTRENKKEE